MSINGSIEKLQPQSQKQRDLNDSKNTIDELKIISLQESDKNSTKKDKKGFNVEDFERLSKIEEDQSIYNECNSNHES